MRKLGSLVQRTFLCAGTIFFSAAGFGQPTIDARFVTSIVGSTFSVKVQIKTDTGTDDLGTSNLVFDFNSNGITFPALPAAGSDYIYSNFTNSTNANYSVATVTRPFLNKVSLNIELNNDNLGTVVPTVFTDVATLNFTIVNASLNAGLTWDTANTVVFDGDNSTLWLIGIFQGQDPPLPIQLSRFTALYLGENRARLDWTTLTELNNFGFNVQKSIAQPNNYQTIPNSFVPGHGNTTDPQHYTFTDENVTSGVWYYRLEQIDYDGTRHYTDGVRLDIVLGAKEVAPIEFALLQNYPNPFNPSTEIKFSVEATGRASVKVFNLIGQEVATLFNGMAEAGQYYKVRLDAANLPSGVYFYRLQNENKSELRKMILLK